MGDEISEGEACSKCLKGAEVYCRECGEWHCLDCYSFELGKEDM
jgi:hypothetical protein